jgi:hypothetical protein
LGLAPGVFKIFLSETFVVVVYLLMLSFSRGDIGNFQSNIASQMTNIYSHVWDLCQVVSSGGWQISVEFKAVALFKKILESSSWGVAIVWVIGELVAVIFVSRGSSDDFFLSERLLVLE